MRRAGSGIGRRRTGDTLLSLRLQVAAHGHVQLKTVRGGGKGESHAQNGKESGHDALGFCC